MEQQEQSVQVVCPLCGATLLVKDKTGARERVVNCPRCQQPITVSFAPKDPLAPAATTPVTPVAPTESAAPAPQLQGGGSGKGLLIGVLSGLVVVLAGLLVWFLVLKDKPSGSHLKESDKGWQSSVSAEVVSVSEAPEWENVEFSASIAPETSVSIVAEAYSYEEDYRYHGYFVGNVGDGQCEMYLDGATGSYTMSYDSHERRLERVSDGVYKAYFKNKYIGTFKGSITNDVYSGKFETPKSGTLKFELMDYSGD